MANALLATRPRLGLGTGLCRGLSGLTMVVMINLLGQSRVAFTMSPDGLLPPWLATFTPASRSPYRILLPSRLTLKSDPGKLL
jgi:amino acid transporter